MNEKDRHEKTVQRWKEALNVENGQGEILEELLEHLDNCEAARPFIVRDMLKGVGRTLIIERYGITDGQYRGIGVKIGVLKRKRF